MKVDIINGVSMNQNLKAWFNSRPQEDRSKTIDDIIGIDLPTNEFASINLFIESSIVEREIFASMRNHIMWAQGSRVNDVLSFRLDHEVLENRAFAESCREFMIEQSDLGARQDDYRLGLPLLSQTHYSISISFRGLVKVILYFRRVASTMGGPLKDRFDNFADLLENALFDHYGLFELPSYRDIKILDESMSWPNIMLDGSSYTDGIITVTATLPVHLRAQLVRHRSISFRDNFLAMITSKAVLLATQTTDLKVTTHGSRQDFEEVLTKRSCWMANYSVWANFLTKVEVHMGDMSSVLPCASGRCPYHGDAMLRYEGSIHHRGRGR